MNLGQFQRRLARRVRELREQPRQDDLEDFGLSWKTIQKIEYGITDPRASTLLKLCTAFGISLVELLSFEQPRERR